MLNKYAPYILAFTLFIFGLSLGFFAARVIFKDTSGSSRQTQERKQAEADKFFSNQKATIRGEILNREDTILTVKNLDSNMQGKIKISDRLIISRISPNSKNATASSDLNTIEPNKEVLITLEMIKGEYQATLIQYLTPPPGLPPVVKQ